MLILNQIYRSLKKKLEIVGNPEKAPMRTRSRRIVRPCNNKNFDYTGVLFYRDYTRTLANTCTSAYSYTLTLDYSSTNSDSFSNLSVL